MVKTDRSAVGGVHGAVVKRISQFRRALYWCLVAVQTSAEPFFYHADLAWAGLTLVGRIWPVPIAALTMRSISAESDGYAM